MALKVIKNWVALSDYDLETAGAMFRTKRYLYVAFTCQQCIEKLLKAHYIKQTNRTPPYTHNLIRLNELISITKELDNSELSLLESLNYYYIESRYANELKKMSQTLSGAKAARLLKETKELAIKLKSLLNGNGSKVDQK